MAGYSKTPLVKKLGLKDGMSATAIHAPDNYEALLGDDPPAIRRSKSLKKGQDFVHLFTKSRSELSKLLSKARDSIHKDGMVWVSWPKKAPGVPSDVTEDAIRDVCLPMGFVDVKVCAVDDVWSGLKLVIRKELR